MNLSKIGLILFGALLTAPLAAQPASAAPAPATVALNPFFDVGVATSASGATDLFWTAADSTVVHQRPDGTRENLGGRLFGGPAAITIGSTTSVYGVGSDSAVWHRQFSGGVWGPWRSDGGGAFGRPGVTCTGSGADARPVLYVQGRNLSLWRKAAPTAAWIQLGNPVVFSPGGVAATGGVCSPAADGFFVDPVTRAVFDNFNSRAIFLGGSSLSDPSAIRPADGSTEVYVVGQNSALYSARRAADGATWSHFTKIGGLLTGSPTAQLVPAHGGTSAQRVVYGRGGDGLLWKGVNTLGTPTWTWHRV